MGGGKKEKKEKKERKRRYIEANFHIRTICVEGGGARSEDSGEGVRGVFSLLRLCSLCGERSSPLVGTI